MNIEDLNPGSRIKVEGCKKYMIVLENNWVADLYFNPPSLTELQPGTKATHFWDGLTWKPFSEETAHG